MVFFFLKFKCEKNGGWEGGGVRGMALREGVNEFFF